MTPDTVIREWFCSTSRTPRFTLARRLRWLFLDVFSCKLFDVGSVVEISHEAFGDFNIAESTVLDRGHHWASDAEIELGRWLESR
jgi:hypothetical protein